MEWRRRVGNGLGIIGFEEEDEPHVHEGEAIFFFFLSWHVTLQFINILIKQLVLLAFFIHYLTIMTNTKINHMKRDDYKVPMVYLF